MKKQYKLIISLLAMILLVSTFSLADVYAKGKNISKSFKTKKPVVDVRGSIENEKGISLTEISWSKVKGADGYSIPTTAKQASWDQKQDAIEIIDLT